MKKRTKILLAILGVFVIAITAVIVWQWNNIKSVTYFIMYSDDELDQLAKENDELIESAMGKVPEISLRDLNEEERELLASGVITEEDAIQLILGNTTLSKLIANNVGGKEKSDDSGDSDNNNSDDKSNGNSDVTTGDSASNSNLDSLLAQAYVLRAKYGSSLEGLKQSAIAEYNALPEEQRTSSAKTSIGSKYLGAAGSLEGSCDTQMDSLLAEIKAELIAEGKDTSLVKDIRSAYAAEKSVTKAQYLSMYR